MLRRRGPRGARIASIPRRRDGRRTAPDAAAEALRLNLGALELVETGERIASRHAREPFAHHHGVDALPVLGHRIREPAVVDVSGRPFRLETDPPMQEQPRQLVARLVAVWRSGVEAMTR